MMFIYEMNTVVNTYLGYPSRAALKASYRLKNLYRFLNLQFKTEAFSFPVVTVCSTNQWKKSKLDPVMRDFVGNYSDSLHYPISNLTVDEFDFNVSSLTSSCFRFPFFSISQQLKNVSPGDNVN